MSYKTDRDLDRLKYDIYKKSGLADYITFKQFLENTNVAYTFSELKNNKKQKKSKKDLKMKKKSL